VEAPFSLNRVRPRQRRRLAGRLETFQILELLSLLAAVLYGLLQRDDFNLDLVGKFYLLAIFALTVDLVWGYAGLITLGHAIFFGAGGYVAALVLVKHVGGLPPSIPLALVLSVVLAVIMAGILGMFLFSGLGVQGGYFALATLAVSFLLEQFLTSSNDLLGGYNGIPGLPYLTLGPLDVSGGVGFYWFSGLLLLAAYVGLQALLRSRLGLVIRGLREKEHRLSYLGYDTMQLKLGLFVISAALAGFVGCLYAIHDAFTSPQLVGVVLSTQVVIWVAIGGAGTLLGPIFGTLLVNGASSGLSRFLVNEWLLILAAILIVVIRFAPAGLLGAVGRPKAPAAQPRDTLAEAAAAATIAAAGE
jgi:urea transport system permease protein